METLGHDAVEALIEKAARASAARDLRGAVEAATRALVEAAPRGDLEQKIRAAVIEADALLMLNHPGAALTLWLSILHIASDPATRDRVSHLRDEIGVAFMFWNTLSFVFMPDAPIARFANAFASAADFQHVVDLPGWREALRETLASRIAPLAHAA